MSPPVVEIRPATVADAHALVLRAADRAEVEALTSRDPHEALVASVERSAVAWAGLADGELVCLFGVVPLAAIGVTGVPWLLGSEAVTRYGRPFLRRNRLYLREMQRQFPVLRNVVDARNTVSIRWLRWLGFTLGTPQPMGVHGLPFIPFTLKSTPC